jgi:hypothetical protein
MTDDKMEKIDEIEKNIDEIMKSMKLGEKQTIMVDGVKSIIIEKKKGSLPIDAIPFHEAALKIEQRLSVSVGRSYTILRGLCASGEVRSVGFEVGPEVGPEFRTVRLRQLVPRTVRPSEWGQVEVDLEDPRVRVSHGDLDHWLDRQGEPAKPPVKPEAKPKAKAKQGKRPRIIALLQQWYPQGVPEPALCVRQTLISRLLKTDPTLGPTLDEETLKKAIDEYNGSIRNDPN